MTSTATLSRSTKGQIVAAAGSGNNSAVQYHFGSKEQLVVAIFENRLRTIDDRRALLIAQLEPSDIRAWVECYLLPLLEQGEKDGSHYMSFIAAVEHQVGLFENLPERFRARTQSFYEAVAALMTSIPEPLRSHRILQVVRLSVHAASARERAKAQGLEVLPFAMHVADLLDGWTGFLQAPASRDALSAVRGTTPPPLHLPFLL